jgi:hypothetical protein
MTTVKSVAGPDPAFLYLLGEIEGFPQCTVTRSVSLAALASGALNVADEKSALIAEVEQNHTNWQAAQAALQEL